MEIKSITGMDIRCQECSFDADFVITVIDGTYLRLCDIHIDGLLATKLPRDIVYIKRGVSGERAWCSDSLKQSYGVHVLDRGCIAAKLCHECAVDLLKLTQAHHVN